MYARPAADRYELYGRMNMYLQVRDAADCNNDYYYYNYYIVNCHRLFVIYYNYYIINCHQLSSTKATLIGSLCKYITQLLLHQHTPPYKKNAVVIIY